MRDEIMQGEPIQFGTVAASRAKRSAAGFTQPIRSARKSTSETKAVSVLDEAFADFIRVDAGSSTDLTIDKPVQQSRPSMTQALIADIATQLEALDTQRRQLARLLESVDTSTTV
jgi:hypothetical protein